MADKVYPEGVTAMDHAQHDLRMGRAPNQSSVETFLKERTELAAQEKVGHLPSEPSERDDEGELAALSAAASPGEWSVWAEKIMGAHDAIVELKQQVEQTRPIGDHLYLLNAGGKCPATTGCGPCSEANAKFIVALVNAYRSGKLKEIDPA